MLLRWKIVKKIEVLYGQRVGIPNTIITNSTNEKHKRILFLLLVFIVLSNVIWIYHDKINVNIFVLLANRQNSESELKNRKENKVKDIMADILVQMKSNYSREVWLQYDALFKNRVTLYNRVINLARKHMLRRNNSIEWPVQAKFVYSEGNSFLKQLSSRPDLSAMLVYLQYQGTLTQCNFSNYRIEMEKNFLVTKYFERNGTSMSCPWINNCIIKSSMPFNTPTYDSVCTS